MTPIWVIIVDGECYGLFKSNHEAHEWVKKEFPVAYGQQTYSIHKYNKIK